MGDMRQFKLIRSHMPLDAGRVLEVGSRNYGNKFGIRSLFPESVYVGTDLTPGEDVDVVCDFCQPHGPFPDGTFDCVICCSVLEHTRQPWVAAANIEAMLREGGALLILPR